MTDGLIWLFAVSPIEARDLEPNVSTIPAVTVDLNPELPEVIAQPILDLFASTAERTNLPPRPLN
ncbi:hypothetical protein DM01DRAFT_330835 [Hesseltinella vesiculosa]|uniref:Uncharacterized protein n=1 Tax=Hesseltinella vesiculosa TaxID=101127 RepID=A0A1X2GGP8_9FUNG|nr:hypothetical protein DM01DRAFT_330835 [Hesseltinella vesiculosa]